jgi:hypothetical protein
VGQQRERKEQQRGDAAGERGQPDCFRPVRQVSVVRVRGRGCVSAFRNVKLRLG